MEFRTTKVLGKVLLKLFLENYAIKVSYSAYFKGISVKASLLGAWVLGLLGDFAKKINFPKFVYNFSCEKVSFSLTHPTHITIHSF